MNTVLNNSDVANQIQSNALQGRFLLGSKWEQLGWIEWIFRKIFGFCCSCVDSVEYVCGQRSWRAIENEAYGRPSIIADRIEKYFLDSRKTSHPLNKFSSIITDIYMLIISREDVQDRHRIHEFVSHPRFRWFNHTRGGPDNLTLVASKGPNRLHFYEGECVQTYESVGNALSNARQQQIARIVVSKNKMIFQMGADYSALFEVGSEGDKESFVFREPTTRRILAVATLRIIEKDKRQVLRFAVADPTQLQARKIEFIHLHFTMFYKAQMNFPNAKIMPYPDETTIRRNANQLI